LTEKVIMEYGQVKGVDKKVSRLVQGTIMLNEEDVEGGLALLDGVFALGCNTFDSAHGYGGGQCERVLGQWMEERGNREAVVVISKSAHLNRDRNRVTPFDITSDLFDSLARLRSDYMDIHLLHRDDPSVPVGPIVEVLNEHMAAGRIRAFGGSNWQPDRIEQANEYADKHNLVPFVASSPNYSLAEQVEEPWKDCITISGQENDHKRAWYAANEMPLFTWSSLARGFFSGRITRQNFASIKEDLDGSCVKAYCYEQNFQRLDRVQELAAQMGKSVPQVALAFILRQPLNVHALIGCEKPEEFEANLEALAIELSPAELEWLDLRRDSLA
jgi:aryl-alcohol dehydrogenase-like predicted oxidoreductase